MLFLWAVLGAVSDRTLSGFVGDPLEKAGGVVDFVGGRTPTVQERPVSLAATSKLFFFNGFEIATAERSATWAACMSATRVVSRLFPAPSPFVWDVFTLFSELSSFLLSCVHIVFSAWWAPTTVLLLFPPLTERKPVPALVLVERFEFSDKLLFALTLILHAWAFGWKSFAISVAVLCLRNQLSQHHRLHMALILAASDPCTAQAVAKVRNRHTPELFTAALLHPTRVCVTHCGVSGAEGADAERQRARQ